MRILPYCVALPDTVQLYTPMFAALSTMVDQENPPSRLIWMLTVLPCVPKFSQVMGYTSPSPRTSPPFGVTT